MFITFEGVDGSGKSLQASLIGEKLKERGRKTCVTREPGGTKGAEELRDLVLNGSTDRWSSMSELLIFTAARRDHCERVIWPALERGEIVICDRFVDSTRLYQGLENSEMAAAVAQIHEIAIRTLPDLTLIFDIDPKQAFGRMNARGDKDMRFEGHGLEFQNLRRAGFLEIAKNEPERCVVIDAAKPIRSVTKNCLAAIEARLSDRATS